MNLFRHKHEIESGRTSSVGMEILGFDTKGEVITSDVPGREYFGVFQSMDQAANIERLDTELTR